MKLPIKLRKSAPVTLNNVDGTYKVDARDLHRYLEVKSKFADWIKNRIKEYDFEITKDFDTYTLPLEGNNASSIQYEISMDMAKELGMVERNSKGREIRKFFIACEKALTKIGPGHAIPQTYSAAMRLAADNQDKLDAVISKVKEDAPKVEFFDTVVSMPDGCPISIACQVAGLSFGQNTLYRRLRCMGVLIESGVRYNLPKQAYVKKGLFSVKETIYNSKDSKTTSISFHTDVTQKGVAWLIKTFSKRKAGFKKS